MGLDSMKVWTIVLMAMAAVSAVAGPVREWDWHIPPEIYRELEFTDRAAVDRAVKIFQQAVDAEASGKKVTDLVPRYRAARGEWKKVQIQAESEDFNGALLAYVVFMQAYSCHLAHDRNESIKIYGDVLDLYADQAWVILPTRYMLHLVHTSMGDIKASNRYLDEIVADKRRQSDALWVIATNARAERYRGEGKLPEAMELWRTIAAMKPFPGTSPARSVQTSCEQLLRAYTMAQGNFEEVVEQLFNGVDDRKKGARAQKVFDTAMYLAQLSGYRDCNNGFFKDLYPKEKKRKEAMERTAKAFLSWFKTAYASIEQDGRIWDGEWLLLAIFDGKESAAERMKHLSRLRDEVRKTTDKKTRNERVRRLTFALIGRGESALAREVAQLMDGARDKIWFCYEVEYRCGQWNAALQLLDEILGMKPSPPPEETLRAKWAVAEICADKTKNYERAIKTYLDINQPPKSLWPLAECYRASGKKPQGYQTLTEIASIFPDAAPSAILKMAGWYLADGNKEKAIALYRRLLSQPEWKERSESSAAHQALERLGVATGGAMTNTVR